MKNDKYYMDKNSTTIEERMHIHQLMEDIGIHMGSSTKSRLKSINSQDYHYWYHPNTKSFYAAITSSPDKSKNKNYQWWLDYVRFLKTGSRIINDNSDTAINTMLDRQIENLTKYE